MIIAEYIWHDSKSNLRSKTRVIHDYNKKISIDKLPAWNFDGSSTDQATTENSELILKPVFYCKDPFRNIEKNVCILVLCDIWISDTEPHENNTRVKANNIFHKFNDCKILFGLEQEFFILFDGEDHNEYQEHYCMGNRMTGREYIEDAFEQCLTAGLKITGYNSEVSTHQWEFQICQYGITAADELIILRYILNKIADKYGYIINLHPKPFPNENGSGCHINFSTEKMRKSNSIEEVKICIEKLKNNHKNHIENYGYNNIMRLTGSNETSDINVFTSGKGDRTASIRIPTNTNTYIEDRRPASNIDPYLATSTILNTICRNKRTYCS